MIVIALSFSVNYSLNFRILNFNILLIILLILILYSFLCRTSEITVYICVYVWYDCRIILLKYSLIIIIIIIIIIFLGKRLDIYLKIPQSKREKHSRPIYSCVWVPTETSCDSCLISYLILAGCLVNSI